MAGASLGWAHGTQRDDASYFTTSNERFETDSFALTSGENFGAVSPPASLQG